jgi:cob(I)alamin adenosyltransferase
LGKAWRFVKEILGSELSKARKEYYREAFGDKIGALKTKLNDIKTEIKKLSGDELKDAKQQVHQLQGEIKSLEKFGSKVSYFSVGEGFTWETKSLKKDISLAKKGWKICLNLLKENKHDVYLFDELLYVLKYKFLTIEEVLRGLKLRSSQSHVILTGRDAPSSLIKKADLVTEMKEIKHPFKKGILAQPGIDY